MDGKVYLYQNIYGELTMQKIVREFLGACADWAAGGAVPPRALAVAVAELEPPRISQPAAARDYLWRILSYPERGRALAMINAVNLLGELFPSWTDNVSRQDHALRAVEEIHLERWSEGLTVYAFQRVCAFHDAGVDGRLNGWALTALATLLCAADDDAASYISSLLLDLTALEVTEGEGARLTGIITEFPTVYTQLARGEHDHYRVLPGTVVAALAHLLADAEFDPEHRAAAIAAADGWLRLA
ncbi:MAG: hypothetical protein IPH10_08250 [bacterium]|nr:hypothetical protein [bacterium]